MNTKTKKIIAIIGGLAMSVMFLVMGSKELSHSIQLASRGKATTAEVLEAEDDTSSRLHWHTYYLQVQFQPEGGDRVSKRVEVGKKVYLAAMADPSVKVHYLAEDPTICAAGDTVELRYGNLLWGVMFLFVAGYLFVFFKKPADKDEAVEEIEANLKPLTQAEHEWVPATADNFKHLDLGFYDEGRRYLEQLGYRFLCDEEDVTLRRRFIPRTFVRFLLSADQTTTADLFHFKPGWMLRVLSARDAKVMDLETRFTDGCFVCTSNAEMAGKLDSPPSIDALHMAAGTPLDIVFQAHQNRVGKYLANHHGVQPVKLNGLADVRRTRDEMQRIKAEFRRRTGLSKAELERLGGQQGKAVDQLHDILTERRERNERSD